MKRILLFISFALAVAGSENPHAYSAEKSPQGCGIQYALLNLRLKFNAYVTSRNLGEYRTYLPREFETFLETLGPDAHWIDSGTGEANALIQYLAEAKKSARVTGVVYSGKRPKKAPDALRYLSGRKIEDIPDEELGLADLITDFFGPTSYSTRVSEVLNKYVRLLKPGGRAFISVTSESAVLVDGRPTPLLAYLVSQKVPPGIEITYSGKWLVIRKLDEVDFAFPELELIQLKSGAPPERLFREKRTLRGLQAAEALGLVHEAFAPVDEILNR